MRTNRLGIGLAGTLTLVSSIGYAQSAQLASSPPLQTLAIAEQAFIEALLRNDRTAFQELLTVDSVFLFPKRAEGPEAIANSWLPFLMERGGATLVMTSDGAIISDSLDQGSSTGTFAIRGHTAAGVRTIPAGTFSIAWRRINGAWKIKTLDGTGNNRAKHTGTGGVGGYRFGMSRLEVSNVAECAPYSNVSRTGGIECPKFTFEGRTMNISFLFDTGGLSRIQLWVYSGDSESEAHEAIERAIDYLKRTSGEISIGGLPDVQVTPDLVLDMLKKPVPPGRLVQVEISSRVTSGSEKWFARIGRHQFGFAVMLFADPN